MHAARLYHSIRIRSHRTRTPRRARSASAATASGRPEPRPATPTAVFATAPAEGSVADALSAACAERKKPSAIGPSSSYVLWKTTDSSSDVPRPISQLYLRLVTWAKGEGGGGGEGAAAAARAAAGARAAAAAREGGEGCRRGLSPRAVAEGCRRGQGRGLVRKAIAVNNLLCGPPLNKARQQQRECKKALRPFGLSLCNKQPK